MVYPCHQLVVINDLSTGEQRFLMGHTAKVAEEGGRRKEIEGERVGRERKGGWREGKVRLSLFLISRRCRAWL